MMNLSEVEYLGSGKYVVGGAVFGFRKISYTPEAAEKAGGSGLKRGVDGRECDAKAATK